uniref:Baseplate hub n=1 Tax=Acinetobacter phage vB_AbaSt_W16 TaxID=3116434 RepID=A0AB38ZCD3_9CAUD
MFEKKLSINLDTESVNAKTYTLREHTALNLAKLNADSELLKKAYSDILMNNTSYTHNEKHQAELILIMLIAASEHEDIVQQDYTCECGHTQSVKLNVSHTYIDYNDVSIEELYPIDKFKLKLRWPKLWADDNITKMIVECIEAIYIGTERINIEDLNDTELNDLYELLTEEHLQKIKNILLTPKPVLPVPIKCKSCGKSHVHIIKGFKSFMEIL